MLKLILLPVLFVLLGVLLVVLVFLMRMLWEEYKETRKDRKMSKVKKLSRRVRALEDAAEAAAHNAQVDAIDPLIRRAMRIGGADYLYWSCFSRGSARNLAAMQRIQGMLDTGLIRMVKPKPAKKGK